MRRRLESALPVAVLAGFFVTVLVVNLLLSNAERRGIEALEEAALNEVGAVARSQDQRLDTSFKSSQTVLKQLDFALEVGSSSDEGQLRILEGLGVAEQSGFYLVDSAGTITAGVNLLPEVSVGLPFDWPGYTELLESPAYQRHEGGVLPVAEPLTTTQQAYALVFELQGEGSRRGTFVYENVVAPNSAFNQEISQLGRGETGQFLFLDSNGIVLASNDASLLGNPVDDGLLTTEPLGVHRRDGRVIAIADVPFAGWRVMFRQDVDEFEASLSEPLQNVGRVLILALLLAGFLFTALLYRRLRTARAEQERLQQLSEAQQELVSIVSHELRTPVAGVLGFLETSLDHWDQMDDDERRTEVGRAAANARRLQALTRDVLDTQRVDAGGLVYVLERRDLRWEVEQAVQAVRDLDQARDVELLGAEEPIWVQADGDRLQQVLANLLDNARRNSPAASPIEVEVNARDGMAEVRITDHGAGITEDALERIFDKFVRSPGASVSGTGLGLYISRQILEAHHGRIWAESAPGAGATFRFTLPLDPASKPKL